MSHIFGAEDSGSEENDKFKVDNEYAKKYDTWRKKEEINKLKTKYGEDVLDEEESSSSSDDEEGVEITVDVEKDFFRTLACLKNKDPSIYKQDVNFFGEHVGDTKIKKKKKDKPVFLKDYERNLIVEKGGVLSDEEDDNDRPSSPTYNEEQRHLKESFKKAIEDSDEENEDNWGGILKQRDKTKDEAEKEESDYKLWLAGQEKKPENKKIVKDLKPLKEYWTKPDLDEGEKFLRDYILKKKYLDNENEDYIPTYAEVVHDSDQDLSNDEENVEKQEEFEYKYNFRYEEPDQDFIKRYPRTMETSLRKTDDRRKVKRQEVKERKKTEKAEKMQEVKKMQEFKLKEIQEKLEKLKEITGNTSLGFADEDIDGDFDPEEHDKKMQALFNDEFYTAPEDEQKPEFPDIDEELEIENWERYTGDTGNTEPYCEDDDFNMDCDYDPQASTSVDDDQDQGRKKRKRKSKFAAAVSKPKPKYDPGDKKFEKYFEEYYKLDCEDIVGDIPCRFKYRKVVPNDFGLTTEEILLANERELNKWCSLKKAVQIRTDEVEKYDQMAYHKKGQNINLKKKILPSLFTATKEDSAGPTPGENESKPETIVHSSTQEMEETGGQSKNLISENVDKEKKSKQNNEPCRDLQDNTVNKKRKRNISASEKTEGNDLPEVVINKNENVSKEIEINKNKNSKTASKKKKKKKKKKVKKVDTASVGNVANKKANKNKKKPKSDTAININGDVVNNKKRKSNDKQGSGNKRKKQKFSHDQNKSLSISDARLSAYGINPKKFKNKIKYKK